MQGPSNCLSRAVKEPRQRKKKKMSHPRTVILFHLQDRRPKESGCRNFFPTSTLGWEGKRAKPTVEGVRFCFPVRKEEREKEGTSRHTRAFATGNYPIASQTKRREKEEMFRRQGKSTALSPFFAITPPSPCELIFRGKKKKIRERGGGKVSGVEAL